MSRCIIFSLTLVLVCGTSSAGMRDWLDRADDMARTLEHFTLFPTRIIYTILGTRRVPDGPLKRVIAESKDGSDLITIIRSPHSPMDISNIRYPEEPPIQGPSRLLTGPLGERINKRLDKVQEGLANRMTGVADRLTESVGKRLDKVGERVVESLPSIITDRLPGRLTGRLGGFFNSKSEETTKNPNQEDKPNEKNNGAPSATKPNEEKKESNGILSGGLSGAISSVTNLFGR